MGKRDQVVVGAVRSDLLGPFFLTKSSLYSETTDRSELFLPSQKVWCTATTVEVAAASLIVDGRVVACLGAFFCGGASGFGEQRTDADAWWWLDSVLTRSFDFYSSHWIQTLQNSSTV
jgi:hypothetical protein